MRGAVIAYPKCQAVLVRNHGIYVWGETWEKAKTQSECLHYLMTAAWELRPPGVGLSAGGDFLDMPSINLGVVSSYVSVPSLGHSYLKNGASALEKGNID